jgi:D-beta-D-heptose 7-phosphate kinase/D-beta-D-heptose 1-phosphate adenosyltransferase
MDGGGRGGEEAGGADVKGDVAELLARLAGRQVLVVGDLILDRYVTGDVPRISPEAPVPVVHVRGEEEKAGGAANVAANVASLGGRALLAGVCGRDEAGATLRARIREAGVSDGGVRVDGSRPTVQKTRILARHQQMLRVDREVVAAVATAVESRLLAWLRRRGRGVDAIVLSDYAKGVLTPGVIGCACALGAEVLVDPKGRDFVKYRGAHAITPNAQETEAATGCDTRTIAGCRDAAKRMLDQIGFQYVVITRGAQGIYWRTAKGEEGEAATRARAVFDVTGAGDTVIAVLALARAAGIELGDAVELANAAAGLVVEKLGAASVTPTELASALIGGFTTAGKVTTLAEAAALAQRCRAQGRRVVLTNGCFDLLHAGHVQALEHARSQGEALLVAVNDDASVRRAKGRGRPVQALERRLRLLASLACVDVVFPFSADTPAEVVRAIAPDVLVKGEDWKTKGVVGRELVEQGGGSVVLAPLLDGESSSAIIARIREGRGAEEVAE